MTTNPNFFGTVLKAIACTRNRNFDNAAYEQGVIQPTRRIRVMMNECGENHPSEAQIHESFMLLKQIFETKGVDVPEQQMRLNEIIERNGLHSIVAGLNVPAPTPMTVARVPAFA